MVFLDLSNEYLGLVDRIIEDTVALKKNRTGLKVLLSIGGE